MPLFLFKCAPSYLISLFNPFFGTTEVLPINPHFKASFQINRHLFESVTRRLTGLLSLDLVWNFINTPALAKKLLFLFELL